METVDLFPLSLTELNTLPLRIESESVVIVAVSSGVVLSSEVTETMSSQFPFEELAGSDHNLELFSIANANENRNCHTLIFEFL